MSNNEKLTEAEIEEYILNFTREVLKELGVNGDQVQI